MSTAVYTEPYALQSGASLQLPERASVTVIIPCYNEERFIGKALANLVEQYSSEAYEIIVVDGMSNDQTRAVVTEFRQSHLSFQYASWTIRSETFPMPSTSGSWRRAEKSSRAWTRTPLRRRVT